MIRNGLKEKYERIKKQRRPVHRPGHPIKPVTIYDRRKSKKIKDREMESGCTSIELTNYLNVQ